MRVLVIGGGGREHALCWKLSRGKDVEKIYCAPGNAGISEVAECVDIGVSDFSGLRGFALENGVDLTVVGAEVPLCGGVTDFFREKGLKVFGPDKSGSRLEGSKVFSKCFMRKYGIPTAVAAFFTDKDSALEYVGKGVGDGVVVKADGLAAGKGVILAKDKTEAAAAVEQCFSGFFGDAGREVVIEEMLYGEEASILALTDGKNILPLASSQDHKRAYDGDLGPNTGGMGAYSPAPVVTDEIMCEIRRTVLEPFLSGVMAEGMDYRGIIYAGIMLTECGPKVLEFNVRFGDPETQAVLMRLDSDLADAMLRTAECRLDEVELEWSEDAAVCVVMAAKGYPGAYGKGNEIRGLAEASGTGAVVFHAGTGFSGGKVVSAGGRVLGVTGRGGDIRSAARNAYEAVSKISWEGCWYRKDIAHRALSRGR